jgi:hypothetical protein
MPRFRALVACRSVIYEEYRFDNIDAATDTEAEMIARQRAIDVFQNIPTGPPDDAPVVVTSTGEEPQAEW